MFRGWFTGLLLALIAQPALSAEITVAVAANFFEPMQKLAAEFTDRTANQVRLVSGSSGRFVAQIQNGAPFDLFFSADQSKPAALEAAGQSVAGSRFTYAIGALVLWSPQANLVDDGGLVLESDRYRRLAIANPKLAPYGAAAMQVLEALGVAQVARSRLVQGENISQTFQFVVSGNAQLGFVALSQVWRDGAMSHGSGWLVSSTLYDSIRQDAVILNRAANNSVAWEFSEFVRSPDAESIIQIYGYGLDTP